MARIILKNALAFDGNNPGVPGTTIVISGSHIESVGLPSVSLKADDEVYDLEGRAVLPGLGTGHYHGDAIFTDLSDVHNVFFGTERPAGVMMAAAIKSAQNLLISGHTMAVGAACGYNHDVCVQMAIAEGLMEGPHLLASGQHVETTASENDRAKWWFGMQNTGLSCLVDGPDEIRRAIRKQISEGVEIIKLYPTGGHGIVEDNTRRYLTSEELRVAVDTAHDLGKKIRGHIVWRHMIEECVEAGVDVIDHGDEVDEKLIDLMLEKGTYWVPSPKLLKAIIDVSATESLDEKMNAGVAKDFANLAKMLPLANKLGVKILPGDDYGIVPFIPHIPGIYATEYSIYVDDMGIDPLDVIRWATVNVASLMGRAGELGTVAPGAAADLIVVNGDPSEKISILAEPLDYMPVVMKGGKFFRNELTSLPVSSVR